MRQRLNEERLRAFMRGLAREATAEGRVYITGGGSAVLLGWRESTLDVDIKLLSLFERIRSELYRYPAISPRRFEERVRKLQ